MLMRALKDSFTKLDAGTGQNPVMFLVYLSALLTTVLFALSLGGISDGIVTSGFILAIAVILWLTCLFSTLQRPLQRAGQSPGGFPCGPQKDVSAHKLEDVHNHSTFFDVPGATLKRGDLFLVNAGEQIAADGEVVDGAASVDESAITGESAPVIREAGGDRSAVTGGTTVLSDWLVVR